jgi:integrase
VTDSTDLPLGVDRHGDGYRVRVRFGDYRHVETGFKTTDQAAARAIQLREMRQLGLVPEQGQYDPDVAATASALLMSKKTHVSKKTGRRLRQSTIDWWERITDPWVDLYGRLRVSQLRRVMVEDRLAEAALEHVPEANNQLAGIKAVLRHAEARGATVDRTILALETIPHAARKRVALTAEQLEFFAARAPEHGRRMLAFKGTVGCRWSELVTFTEKRFDAEVRTMFVPAGLCKGAVDKTIDLTVAEVHLVREQMLARAAGADTIFCSATGLGWHGRYGDWWREVWEKTVRWSARDWREVHGLDDDADTPFEWRLRDDCDDPVVDDVGEPVFDRLQPHDLRATAITLMRDAGLTKEQTAARVGHADTGQLIDRIYDQGDKRRRAQVRQALDELAPLGLVAALVVEPEPQPSDRPAAVGLEP